MDCAPEWMCSEEEKRPRWGVRTSNPGRAARRSLVGSTPILFRQHHGMARQRQLPGYRGFMELRGHFRRLFQVTIVYERVEVDGMLDEFVTL
jgi:hypothetical protein